MARRDHQHENIQIALHHLGEPLDWNIAELVLGGEALADFGRILEARVFGQPQRMAHQRRLLADFCSKRAEGGDDLARDALIRAEYGRRHIGLPPVETAFADETERIGEIVERGAQLPDGQQKLISGKATLAGLNGRNCLAILKTEQAREVVLRELLFLPQSLQTLSDQWVRHSRLLRARYSLANRHMQDYLAN